MLARCRDAAQRLAPQWPALLARAELEALYERRRVLEDAGVDSELAVRVASGEISTALLDIAEVAACSRAQSRTRRERVLRLGTLLEYAGISERAVALPIATHWDMLARAAALAELARLKRALTMSALDQSRGIDAPDVIVEAGARSGRTRWNAIRGCWPNCGRRGGASLSMLLVIVREMAVLERA